MEGKEEESKQRWNIARWLAWQNVILSPNIKPAHKPRTAQAFCRFPWEIETDEEIQAKAEKYRVSEEEIAELNRIFASLDKKS